MLLRPKNAETHARIVDQAGSGASANGCKAMSATTYQHVERIRGLPGYRALTNEGVAYVERALANAPARPVGETSLFSVSGAYASKRFPFLVDYESSGCEKPFVLKCIVDQETIDLLAQPPRLLVTKHDKRGRKKPSGYVADYLWLGREQFALVEAKPLAKLEGLSESHSDWVYSTSDGWRFQPGEEVAERYGMRFKVFCPEDLSPTYRANLQIIARLPSEDLLAPRSRLIGCVRNHLENRPQTVLQLCEKFDGLTAAVIYQAIAKNLLYGLIEDQHFDASFVVYRSLEEVVCQQEFLRRTAPQVEGKYGSMHARLLCASASELKLTIAAKARYEQRRKDGVGKDATDYRDEARLRAAAKEGAPTMAAFLRRVGDRGRADPIIDESVRKEVLERAKKYLSDGGVPKQSKMYGNFVAYAEENGLYIPSQEAYRRIYLEKMAPEKAAILSGGKRAFHAARPVIDGQHANPRLLIAGLRAHIDGVYGDARAKIDEDGEYPRPIFYPMLDDITGYVLGVGVKVGRPSRLAVAMAHRDCYLKHGFLPAQLVHDWGAEFINLFVPEMQARFNVGYERRPVGAPRFGGMGEMFNAQFSSFLQNISGGTYFDKCGRSADGNKKSRKTASLSTAQIVEEALNWIQKVWQTTPIGGQECSPEERWHDSLRCFPEAVVQVKDDALARYYTSLPLKNETFSYKDGFRYGGERFTSDRIPDLIRRGEYPTAPRLDCMDASTVHALTSQGPIALTSLDYARTQGVGFGRRIEEMQNLLAARSRARKNQAERNAREARQLHEMRSCCSSEANTEDVPPPVRTTARIPDFSAALKAEPRDLCLFDDQGRSS